VVLLYLESVVVQIVRVAAAVMLQGTKVFIARRNPGCNLALLWEFPGGKLDPGESPEEALIREMEEEFGIRVAVGDFFTRVEHSFERGTLELLAYYTRWLDGKMLAVDYSEYAWVDVDELLNYQLAPADIPIAEKLRREIAWQRPKQSTR
jgi:8-oxo-dGTP diphosphatase